MIDIVDPRIEQYLRGLYEDGDAVRAEMERLAAERKFPIVGPLVGRKLAGHWLAARSLGQVPWPPAAWCCLPRAAQLGRAARHWPREG